MSVPPSTLAPDTFSERLYRALAPLARQDADNDWSLLVYCNALGEMFQVVEDLVRDTPDGPGWSVLLDLDRCPDDALPWLAQFAGVRVLGGSTPDQMRARIASTDGFKRGTPAAMRAAAQATLTGTKTVVFRERDHDPADTPDYAYYLTVITRTDETPLPLKSVAALPLTVSGNEITDAVRTAAPSWPTTKQGGSVDGPPFDFYLAASGNEITDQQRAAAAAWLTTQQGGSVDGPPFDSYFTLSGNEITDGLRALAAAPWPITKVGDSTDGLAAPGGVGLWEGRTNLFRRGQCDNITDWGSTTGVAQPRSTDATVPAPFSPQSIKIVCDGTLGQQGFLLNSAGGQAAAAGSLCVASIYFRGVAGASYRARCEWLNTDASATNGADLVFNGTGAWQLITPASVAVAAGKTGDVLRLRIFIDGQRAETMWGAHAQVEKLSGVGSLTVSPYIATSGGATASRGAGQVTAPPTGMSTTQGWMAVRVRMGWAAAQNQSSTFVSLDDGTLNNRISFTRAGASWQSRRIAAGVAGNVANISTDGAFVLGDTRVLIIRWDATTVAISVAGAPFVSAVNGGTFVPTTLNIGGGSAGGGLQCCSQVNWFACGTGTLTDADAAALAAYATLPAASALPGAAVLAVNDFVAPYRSLPATPGGLGIWEAGTNLHRRGQCDVASTDSFQIAGAGVAVAVDATSKPPFSSQSIKTTCDGSTVLQGVQALTAGGQAAAAGSVVVGSLWFKGTKGLSYECWLRWGTTEPNTYDGSKVIVIASGSWQLVTPPSWAVPATKTGDVAYILLRTHTARAEVFWVAHAMLQRGVGAVSPYVATSAAVAQTRSAAKMLAPASLLNTTQGWVAMRLTPGQTASTFYLFSWRDDNNNQFWLRWNVALLRWEAVRVGAGTGVQCVIAGTPPLGVPVSVVMAWTATTVLISVNGSAFVSIAQTNIPALAATSFEIGSLAGSGQCDGNVQWFACGTGTLTNADAATLAALTTLPDKSLLPGAATLAVNDFLAPYKSHTLPQGFGIWGAGTNLFRRGQCDTLTDCNTVVGGTATAIDATVKPPFSSQSVKVTCDGTLANQGVVLSAATGQAAAAGTPGVGSVWFKGVKGLAYFAQVRWQHTDATAAISAQINFIASGVWQLITVPAVAVGAGKTGDYLTIHCRVYGTRADTYWLAHAQLEKGVNVVSPYIATSGGATATRAAARVQAPSASLDERRGWLVCRVRMGFDAGADPLAGGEPRLAAFYDSATSLIDLRYNAAARVFKATRMSGGVGPSVQSAPLAFLLGDVFTVIAKWDNSNVYVSINGGPFVAAANTSVPVLAAATYSIGAGVVVPGAEQDGRTLWHACGTGALSDADAAALHAYGNAGPSGVTTLPGNPTLLWHAVDGNAESATYTALTESATLAALIAQKPGGIVLNYHTADGQDYTQLRANHATYDAVRTAYVSYDAVRNDVPT